eukprot:TRINITY_DN6909_c0_g1_i1.p1 TRINITY_DN6909_c0_g1~~TRINITY_DN6909_c0_g1_i1.p1  ORF type:complete len:532 (-),score=102.87 TRINITY_DN6909_c0_g1_i1:34-1629(-)
MIWSKILMHRRLVALDLVAAAFCLAGLIGLIYHGARLDDYNQPIMVPHFLGIWLSTFMLFYGLQIPWTLHFTPHRGYKLSLASFIQYCIIAVVVFILIIGYYVGFRNDGGTWALFLFPCVLINTYLAWIRMRLAAPNSRISFTVRSKEDGTMDSSDSKPWFDHMVVPKTKAQRIVLLTAAGLNVFVLSIAFITVGLLLGGCLVQAQGYRSYPPRGRFVTVSGSKGQTTEVMIWCTGPLSATQPTIVFDIGGGGHSSSDLYGLQFALNDAGRRVCTYDYPGCGWSGPSIDVTQPQILDQLMAAINEPPPYALLGTMDGGPERILQYALKYPSNVAALIVLDYRPGPSEMEMYKTMRGYTDAQATNYAVSTIGGRFALGNLVRAIGVQWGLMSVFAPPSPDYVPINDQMEKLFLNIYNEKQWQTQMNILASQVANPSTLFYYDIWSTTHTLDPNIPVLWLYANTNITKQCIQYNYSAMDCTEAHRTAEIYLPYVQQAANMTANSHLFVYDDPSTFLSGGPYIPWTTQRILQHV